MKKLLVYTTILLAMCSCANKNSDFTDDKKAISTKPFLVAINVMDIDSTSKWYIENLGFKQLKKNNYPDYDMTISFLQSENLILELVQVGNTVHKDSVVTPDNTRITRIMKIGLMTSNYEYLYKKLKSNGTYFSVDTVYDKNMDSNYFVVYDNEQNPIQIFSDRKHYDKTQEAINENNIYIKPHLMAIFTDNVEITKSWYEDNLGFNMVWSNDIPEHNVKVRILQVDGFNLELLELGNIVSKTSILSDSIIISGFSKITFLTNAFDSLYTNMTNNQVNVYIDSTKSNSDWANRHFIVFDDNNNLIQIID